MRDYMNLNLSDLYSNNSQNFINEFTSIKIMAKFGHDFVSKLHEQF